MNCLQFIVNYKLNLLPTFQAADPASISSLKHDVRHTVTSKNLA